MSKLSPEEARVRAAAARQAVFDAVAKGEAPPSPKGGRHHSKAEQEAIVQALQEIQQQFEAEGKPIPWKSPATAEEWHTKRTPEMVQKDLETIKRLVREDVLAGKSPCILFCLARETDKQAAEQVANEANAERVTNGLEPVDLTPPGRPRFKEHHAAVLEKVRQSIIEGFGPLPILGGSPPSLRKEILAAETKANEERIEQGLEPVLRLTRNSSRKREYGKGVELDDYAEAIRNGNVKEMPYGTTIDQRAEIYDIELATNLERILNGQAPILRKIMVDPKRVDAILREEGMVDPSMASRNERDQVRIRLAVLDAVSSFQNFFEKRNQQNVEHYERQICLLKSQLEAALNHDANRFLAEARKRLSEENEHILKQSKAIADELKSEASKILEKAKADNSTKAIEAKLASAAGAKQAAEKLREAAECDRAEAAVLRMEAAELYAAAANAAETLKARKAFEIHASANNQNVANFSVNLTPPSHRGGIFAAAEAEVLLRILAHHWQNFYRPSSGSFQLNFITPKGDNYRCLRIRLPGPQDFLPNMSMTAEAAVTKSINLVAEQILKPRKDNQLVPETGFPQTLDFRIHNQRGMRYAYLRVRSGLWLFSYAANYDPKIAKVAVNETLLVTASALSFLAVARGEYDQPIIQHEAANYQAAIDPVIEQFETLATTELAAWNAWLIAEKPGPWRQEQPAKKSPYLQLNYFVDPFSDDDGDDTEDNHGNPPPRNII